MDTWRAHMPPGLFLKSEPYGSWISSATPGYDLKNWSRLHGYNDYVDRIGPLPLDRFLGYTEWFIDSLVPGIQDLTVTSVVPGGDGFKVEFAEESPIFARQIIVATGLLPHQHIPPQLSGLPADLVTHTAAYGPLDKFRGRRVAVVGGGQSSLQTTALLHELGADVSIIVRKQELAWGAPIAPEAGIFHRMRRPQAKLCEGWACWFHDTPRAFRMMPESMRVKKALTSFGPAGAWWLRDRVEGVLDLLMGQSIKKAEPHGSGVRLHLAGAKESTIDVDHVIAGTGFRIDVSRLSFLAQEIQSSLVTRANCPLVNRAGETSVRGLYFAGAPTMVSLGSGVRFISGTHGTSAALATSVAHSARRGVQYAAPAAPAPQQQQPLASTGPLSLG
jgi:FAD-dependent urate hydroxylase